MNNISVKKILPYKEDETSLSLPCNLLARILLILLFTNISLPINGFVLANDPFLQRSATPGFYNSLGTNPTFMTDTDLLVFEAEVGQEEVQYYYVSGSGFSPEQAVFIELSDFTLPFTISLDGSSFGKTLEIWANLHGDLDPHMIAVKYAPQEKGSHAATISHTIEGGGGTGNETLTVGNSVALPVKFVSFKAKAEREIILLDWITASETNNSHFEVEISKNPIAGFEKLGHVYSKRENSNFPSKYRFEHRLNPADGTSYYFRLKQVDTDQTFSYSKIIAVTLSAKTEPKVSILSNTFTDSSQLSVSTSAGGRLNIAISSINGKELYRKYIYIEAGDNIIDLHLNSIRLTGMYILTAEFEGKFQRLKLLKE